MQMPSDFAILLSIVNMKLRDGAEGPADVCALLDWDCEELVRRLSAEGYSYDGERNAFVCKG